MSGWLLGNFLWASAAMLLVLAIRRPVAAAFGAGPAYLLWAVPALRLVMPPWPLPVVSDFAPGLDLTIWVPESGAGGAAAGSGLPLGWLLLPWAAGALAFLVWQWLGYRRFLAELSLSSRSLGSHAGLPLVESEAVKGPVALGLLDRRIVVPADFSTRFTPLERALALDHEAVHHRRGDIWWNMLALLLLAANWFNPLAWLAFRAFREDQELACDAAVTASTQVDARFDYARALIKSASRPGMVAACPLNHADQLKRRLKMMNTHRPGRLRLLGGGAAVLLTAGVAASFGGAGLAHPHPEGKDGEVREQRIIIMEHKGGHKAGEHRAGEPGAHRDVIIRRGTDVVTAIAPENCTPSERLVDADEQQDGQRTRVVICAGGQADAATRLERLQRVRARMAENEQLSAESRARVLAALDAEIARLRAQ